MLKMNRSRNGRHPSVWDQEEAPWYLLRVQRSVSHLLDLNPPLTDIIQQVTVLSLFLTSATMPLGKKISLNLTDTDHLHELQKNPLTIKEGVEYG